MNFEAKLVKLFKEFFTATEQHAKALRLKQPQPFGGYQDCDVLVLSSLAQYRLAIECKSILEPSANQLYFSSHFTTDKKGTHQITRMTEFCGETGMRGILAVELRSGVKGNAHEIRFIPWRIVNRAYEDDQKGLSYDVIRAWPQFKRVNGVMNLDQVLDRLKYSVED